MDANDDEGTRAAHQKLAAACAKEMEPALEGGAIVNTLLQTPGGQSADADDLIQATKDTAKETSAKVRCNAVAPGEFLPQSRLHLALH